MRRWLAASTVVVLLVTGCKDAFRARPEIVAEAGGQELKIERLATLMAGIKTVPLTREAAEFISNMWVDHTLFAQAIAAGRNLADSATAAEVLWPEISELVGSRWHEQILAARGPNAAASVDSIYRGDQVRLLQHILVKVPPNSEPPAQQAAKKRATALLARVAKGEDFAKLAREYSEDPGSKADGGYLSIAPRGKWVTAFDSAGWTLAPGARTDLVETPFGYHIIRRPGLEEARPRMVEYAQAISSNAIDAMYLDSLGIRHGLKVESNAPSVMRESMVNKDKAISSKTPLVKYDTGALTVSDFMRWVTALGTQWAADLSSRPDSSLIQFAQLITQNQLLLRQADSAGVRVPAAEWASMLQRYQAQVDSLRTAIGLTESDLSDPATSKEDRSKVAALKVENYWNQLTTGVARPRPIPPQLSALLRQTAPHTMDNTGIAQTLELAKGLKAKADSANPGGKPASIMPGPDVLPGGIPVIKNPDPQ